MKNEESSLTCEQNFVTTWLEYRESCGESTLETIQKINNAVGKKYDYPTIFRWKKGVRDVPYDVLKNFFYPDIKPAIRLKFNRLNIDISDRQINSIESYIIDPFSISSTNNFFIGIGVGNSLTKKQIESVCLSIRPAFKRS